MFKKIAQSSAIALALALLVVPVKQAYADAPVVTGTDPMPSGEDFTSMAPGTTALITLVTLSTTPM